MTADSVGGVFSYALELARMLSRRNVELLLATMGPLPSPEQRASAQSIAGLTLLERPYQLEWMDDPWQDVSESGQWLLELERSFAPELVHLNGYAHAALPFAAPTLVVGHSCVLSWWQAVKGASAPARYTQYLERVRAGLCRAHRVVAPSRAMLSALEQHYGPLPHAEVLYNGCDLSMFRPAGKQPSIVAAGRVWDEAKNLAALERIAASLAWPVSIAGEQLAPEARQGPTKPDGAAVQKLGLLSRPELAALLGSASIFAAPARYEPFGLSILEAAAAGCALVLGDIPSLRELWRGAALFVDPASDEALHAGLARLIADEPLRLQLAERARQRAAEFSSERFAQEYLRLYQTLVARGGSARHPHTDRPSLSLNG